MQNCGVDAAGRAGALAEKPGTRRTVTLHCGSTSSSNKVHTRVLLGSGTAGGVNNSEARPGTFNSTRAEALVNEPDEKPDYL